jgi:hypothetical protein
MSPIGEPEPGSYPLTSTARLPNVTLAFPGEKMSDAKASGVLTPGDAVVPVASGSTLVFRKAVRGDAVTQMAIATRTVDVPDRNPGSIYQEALGPNEIRNLPIAHREYLLRHYSGDFHLTLIVPDRYTPSDLIGWVPAGARPTGKDGTGAWGKMSRTDAIGPFFEVIQPFRVTNDAGTEGILTVRSLRGQS